MGFVSSGCAFTLHLRAYTLNKEFRMRNNHKIRAIYPFNPKHDDMKLTILDAIHDEVKKLPELPEGQEYHVTGVGLVSPNHVRWLIDTDSDGNISIYSVKPAYGRNLLKIDRGNLTELWPITFIRQHTYRDNRFIKYVPTDQIFELEFDPFF